LTRQSDGYTLYVSGTGTLDPVPPGGTVLLEFLQLGGTSNLLVTRLNLSQLQAP
jgi:hypothetical protein